MGGLITFESLSCDPDEFASAPLHGLMAQDCVKQPRAAFQIPDCIKKNVFSAIVETCDHSVGSGLRNSASGIAGCNRDRKNIPLRGRIEIVDFDKPKLSAIGILRDRRLLNDSQIAKSPRL